MFLSISFNFDSFLLELRSPKCFGQFIEAEGDWVQSSLEPDHMLGTGHVMAPTAQILLVCCWRTMKEVALFLGELAENAPIRIGVSQGGLLTVNQVSC